MSRIANRPLTKPREPNRLSDLAQVIAAIVLLIIPAFLYASQRANLHHAERRISVLEQQLVDLEEHRRLLRIELSTERDPRRIYDKAHRLTALREAFPEQIQYLSRLDSSGAPRLTAVSGGADGNP